MTPHLRASQALAALDTLREYETALLGQEGAAAAREMGLAEHAFQTAEVRRAPCSRPSSISTILVDCCAHDAAMSITAPLPALLQTAAKQLQAPNLMVPPCPQACRLAHPDAEWLQLAGLLHGLGKLLAHPT